MGVEAFERMAELADRAESVAKTRQGLEDVKARVRARPARIRFEFAHGFRSWIVRAERLDRGLELALRWVELTEKDHAQAREMLEKRFGLVLGPPRGEGRPP